MQLGNTEVRSMDIYSQEFFLYAYSKIIQDRNNFLESHEGNTYMKQATERRHSHKVLGLLYSDAKKAKAIRNWDTRI